MPPIEQKNLLEKESILAYKTSITPNDLNAMEFSEVLFLENKLYEYLEKEREAYA